MRLDTPRLVLRRLGLDDLGALTRLNADPEVMRYILDGSTLDQEQTRGRFEAMDAHWDEHGFGIFGVEVRDGGELAGWAGLATPTFLPEVMPAVEIGWRLERRWWGRGIATEAAAEVLRYAFVDLGLDRVLSIRHVDNVASGRVMEKLGFRFERRTTVPVYEQPVSVWELDSASYRAAPAS
jgi:RimJ/RimL family protein N-acetyltransferase